jgi:hypothetical protein
VDVIDQHGRASILVNNPGLTIGWASLGRPAEIARLVCFLTAHESAYYTGQIWADKSRPGHVRGTP